MARKPRGEGAASTAKAYQVLGNLEHDGTLYRAGEQIELADDEAKPLLEVHVITPAPEDGAAS